ncbi:DNA repair protein RecO [Sphingobacterium bovistauri]|uniref:DNA repair protein RecO n=1 Tax=Sphingobacterium bovistauri TaxID=2781959 RepID=A0ABS7Z904_9SPHI|nr:DNA repair protein RecO [Sphingobacterium bovistauri]MCA5005350.1 DNA repair protein RecO [Sphingobacterium bovistauri]
MLQKTKGIALKITNYSENSIIAQIFTESFGIQSYIINGAKKPTAKIHVNMLQPLHLLDMVVYHKDNGAIQRIKEATPSPTLQEIPLDITKSSVAIFLNEILYKVLKQQQPDPHLFNFIEQSILWLDQTDKPIQNFHLCFLMKLSRFLGYMPTASAKPLAYFDLVDGVFTNFAPAHTYTLQEPHTDMFHVILNISYEESHTIQMKHEDRIYLLSQIINFYKLHTENFGSVNSLQILEEIFH